SEESSHTEEGLADNAIISGAAGDGEASALSIGGDEASDVSSTDGDAGVDEGETRPRRSWFQWLFGRPGDVDEGPVTPFAPAGDDTALAGSDLPEDVVDVGDDLTAAALEQAVLSLPESVLLASESITDGGEDVSPGEASDVSDGDGPDAVTGDTGSGLHVDLEEGRISDMADLPGQDAILPGEISRTEEGSAGAWGGEDAQDGDVATITDEDGFADVSNEGDVVLGDDPEGGEGGVSSMGAGVTGGDEDASSASPAVDTDANDPVTSGGVSTAEVGPLAGGDDIIDDSGLADDAVIAVVAEDEEALALSVGGEEASGVPITDGDAGAPAVQSIPRRSWLPWRRHRPADVDEDPATSLAPAGDDADLAGPDLPEDVADMGDGDVAALEPAESTPLSLPQSALLASESGTNDESSPGGTDAPDRGGGVKAGASELDGDAAAGYADGDAVPPPETGDVSDRDGPDAVAGDIGPGGGYETGSDGFGESSSVETAPAHLGEVGTSGMADPQEQVGALSEESDRMEEDSVGRGETGSLGDYQDGGVAMIPAEEGYADVGSESHAVLGDDPEGGTGGVTSLGAGLAGGEDDASSVSPAVETEADDSSTSGSDGDSAVPIDAEVSPLMDGQDVPADSGLTNGAIVAGAAGDGEASDVSSTDVDTGADEGETRPRRSWLPWRRHRPADVDEDPVTNLVPAGDDIDLAGSDLPEDVVDMGEGDDAALEQAVLSLPESVLLASESITDGGEDVLIGEAGDVSDGDDSEPVTDDNGPSSHVNLEEGGTSDMADLPGRDGALADESVNMEEGCDGGDRTESDESVEAGDVATTFDEDVFADVGDEGDAVLVDDPEGGASGVTSMGAGVAGGGDDASSVSPAVETNADGRATSGSDSDSAITTTEVCALRGGYYTTGDSGSNVGGMCVLTTDGDASAVSTGDDETSGVSSKDGDANVDEGETRPRRSWFPWRRHRPADVDEDPVADLASAGDVAGLAGSDLPDDVVDVGEDDEAALEQAVLSLSESELLASESITDGGEDVSIGEASDVSDGDDREAVAGDLAPTLHVYLEDGGTRDMADPLGQDGALCEGVSHMEEGSVGDDTTRSGEDAKVGDETTTTTDEDDVADDGGESDAVLGDDPEGGAGGVTSTGDGLSGGDDDASSVSPVVEASDDDSSTSGGEGDSAVSIDAEVSALVDGQDAAACSGAADGAVGAEGGESSAVSTGDDEASDASSTDGDTDADEGETRPRRSWLPWRRHRPADVDEDPVTNLAPAVDDTALAGPDLPEYMVDVGDDDDASLEQAVSTPSSLSESELLASESITDGGECISTGEAGDVSDGNDREAVIGDISPDPRGSDDGGDDVGDDLDDVGENTSVETFTANSEEGARDTTDPPGPDGEFPEESSHMEEVSGGGRETQKDEAIEAGDVATTTDEDVFADDRSEGDVVLGDDPEGGAGGVTSKGAGLTGGDDDASGVSADVATKADGPATSGGDGDAAAESNGEVGDSPDGHDAIGEIDWNGDPIGVSATGGESSAVSTGDDEASDVSPTDGDAGVDEGETRPRRSWLPWRRHRPADVDEDPVTNVEPAGDDAALAGHDLQGDVVDVGDDLTAAALEQAVQSLPESELLASESITDGGEDTSTGEAGDTRNGDAQDVVPDSRGSDGASSIGDDLDDLGESASVEAVTAHLEEGDASDMTDPPGQDRELSEESFHVEEGPGTGHVPGSREDAKAGGMTAVTYDSVLADVGSEADVVLGDDLEGFSDNTGVVDDDDAPVVPVGDISDASGVPNGDAHAAAEDPPTAHRPGETEAVARRHSRSPSQLAADDVDNAAAVSQAAAAASAATAAATAGDDVLELAAMAVPVAAAGVGGAAAGSAPPRSWIRPKALIRLFNFGRAPRSGEEGSQEEESPRMTTSAADGDGVGMPSQDETPTEGVSPASAKDVEETVGLASDADGGVSPASAEEAVDLASNGLTTTTSSVLGEDEDPSAAALGTGEGDGDGSDRDEAGTPALEFPPSLEAGPSAPAASALPSTEASSSRRREEESPGDKAAAAPLPTDPATVAAAEGLSPTAAAGSSAREADEPAAHAASLLSAAEADDNASDTAGPRTPKDVGSVLDVDDGGDDRAPVDAEDAASGSPLSQGAAAEATAAAALDEEGKLRGGVGVGAGAEATPLEDGSVSDDRVVPPTASSGEDLGDAAVGNAAVGNAAASSEDSLDG
ncbi:unnamed protein product, partial [Ectocarpus sp. 4 AP-2014]